MQINLLEFFAHERPWAQLYRLIERLPAWGHYKSALALDEDWARAICDREESGLESPPTGEELDAMSPLGYTDVIGRLDLIADRILTVRTAVQWTVNPKEREPTIQTMPRPETALDRERERRSRRILHEIDALFRGEGLALRFD